MTDRIEQETDVHRFGNESVESCRSRTRLVGGSVVTGAGDRRRSPARGLGGANAPDQLVAVLDRHGDV
jgi:hypothetical protein